MSLPQLHRLRSPRDFSRVYRKGKRVSSRYFAVRALDILSPGQRQAQKNRFHDCQSTGSQIRNVGRMSSAEDASPVLFPLESSKSGTKDLEGPPIQFGISISRKVSKRAVVRNRIKRQIKAILRRFIPHLSSGWQIVIVVRPSAVECSFDDFLRELEYLLKKLEIFTAESSLAGTSLRR